MWKYYIVLFRDDCYGDLVEGAEYNDELPVCVDYNVAKEFDSTGELLVWVKKNTSLEDGEYGISGIFYENIIKE